MDNIIISAACGYTAEMVKPFLHSASVAMPDAGVHLIVSPETQKDAETFLKINRNVVLWPAVTRRSKLIKKIERDLRFPFSRLLPGINKKALANASGREKIARFLHPNFARHFIAQNIIDEIKPTCVLLADSRDIIFQSDPFKNISDGVLCGSEAKPIIEGGWTYKMFIKIYGINQARRMINKPNICAGVSIGDVDSIIKYSRAMAQEAFRVALGKGRNTGDQVVHNQLIHNGLIPNIKIEEFGGPTVIHLAHAGKNTFTINNQGQLIPAGTDVPVAIVHQYNRHTELQEWVDKQFCGANKKINVKFEKI